MIFFYKNFIKKSVLLISDRFLLIYPIIRIIYSDVIVSQRDWLNVVHCLKNHVAANHDSPQQGLLGVKPTESNPRPRMLSLTVSSDRQWRLLCFSHTPSHLVPTKTLPCLALPGSLNKSAETLSLASHARAKWAWILTFSFWFLHFY